MSAIKLKKNSVIVAMAILAVALQLMMSNMPTFAETINYIYDDMDRLIRVEYGDGTAVEYVYDTLGNRLQRATTLSGVPANHPPNPAANPNPPDSATGITTTPTLSWTGGGDPDPGDEVFYYVYFGTSGDELFLMSSGWETSYVPGQLRSSTTYYWKVVSRDSHNANTGGLVWRFTTGNDPPVASFTANPKSGSAPLVVRFTDTSMPTRGRIVSWAWDFNNDGVIDSNLQNPVYTYNSAGTYTVSLAVTDEYGATGTQTKTACITVSGVGETISTPSTPSGTTNGTPGTVYSYSTGGSSSNLDHGGIGGFSRIEYFFDWGDGTNSGWLPFWQGSTASKSWSTTGTKSVRVQARCYNHPAVVSSWSSPLSVTISGSGGTIIYVSQHPTPPCAGMNPCSGTIQGAVNSAGSVLTIKITQETYNENVILNSPKEVTLQGGWDVSFTGIYSRTTINGSITIVNGKIIIMGIVLE